MDATVSMVNKRTNDFPSSTDINAHNEHRQATNNSDHASVSAAVPTHFNLPLHSVKDMLLIRLEVQVTNNPSCRKAREAYFMHRGSF